VDGNICTWHDARVSARERATRAHTHRGASDSGGLRFAILIGGLFGVFRYNAMVLSSNARVNRRDGRRIEARQQTSGREFRGVSGEAAVFARRCHGGCAATALDVDRDGSKVARRLQDEIDARRRRNDRVDVTGGDSQGLWMPDCRPYAESTDYESYVIERSPRAQLSAQAVRQAPHAM
jgi:hypothetical protein